MIAETLFSPRLRAATKEILGHPASGVIGWIGNNRTASGITVDERTAMNYSVCWAATKLLSGTGGSLPLSIYRRVPEGDKVRNLLCADHPAYRLLNFSPNGEMSAMMFRSSRMAFQVNAGNGYAEIERTYGGSPDALWPIHSSRVRPMRDPQTKRLVYHVVSDSGRLAVEIQPRDMLHFPSMMSDDGIIGRGVIQQARESIGFGVATERHGAAFFGNGAVPALVVTHPNKLSEQARRNFRQEWKELYGGPDNAGELALLQEGAKIEKFSLSAEDNQFLETRQHNIEEIARWYGVPPHLIGHLLRSTYNNIEQQSIEFVKYSLLPWLVLIEQEVWRKLLTTEEQATHFAQHEVRALERGDLKSRTDAMVARLFNGESTINEWRAMEGQNPIGPNGDMHFVQSAMIPLDVAASGAHINPGAIAVAPKPAKAEFQAAASEVLREAVERLVRVEVNAARTAASKGLRFPDWLDEFYAKRPAQMREALAAAAGACQASGAGFNLSLLVDSHVAESKSALSAQTDATAAELPSRVAACVASWETTKAERFVRQVFKTEEMTDAA